MRSAASRVDTRTQHKFHGTSGAVIDTSTNSLRRVRYGMCDMVCRCVCVYTSILGEMYLAGCMYICTNHAYMLRVCMHVLCCLHCPLYGDPRPCPGECYTLMYGREMLLCVMQSHHTTICFLKKGDRQRQRRRLIGQETKKETTGAIMVRERDRIGLYG